MSVVCNSRTRRSMRSKPGVSACHAMSSNTCCGVAASGHRSFHCADIRPYSHLCGLPQEGKDAFTAARQQQSEMRTGWFSGLQTDNSVARSCGEQRLPPCFHSFSQLPDTAGSRVLCFLFLSGTRLK